MRNTLSDWTTFGIGGAARRIDIADSRQALIDLSASGTVLGKGSNILASDNGFDGNIVINRYEQIERRGKLVVAGSGARLSALCGYLADNGLSGMEWAVGIPGTVGGAVKMNAGAFLGCISDTLVCAEVLRDGRLVTLYKPELCFGYRKSAIGQSDTVISAVFELVPDQAKAVRARGERFGALRRASQPIGKSAGSVFKNPEGVSVGKVLEEAGLKGLRRGGAEISPVHANIIVNIGGAKAKDVLALIEVMRLELGANGVAAQEEIIYLGDF